MTGKGILEALSFVDEKYIEEAQTGTLRQAEHIVKVLLPLAACLCLVLLGLFSGDTTEIAMENQQEGAIPEPGIEIIVQDKTYGSASGGCAPEMDEAEMPSISEVPSIVLRIAEWTEAGFTATVEKIDDTDIFPVGTLLNVEIMVNICIETYSGDLVTVERRIPTEAEFPPGTLVRVQFEVLPQEENTIRIETIAQEEE